MPVSTFVATAKTRIPPWAKVSSSKGTSFLTSFSINLRYRHDSRYFGPKAALRGGSLFGLKFMLNDVKKEVPFDEETFAHGGMPVSTFVEIGRAHV